MTHKKSKQKTIRNDFDAFSLSVKRLFPKSKISLKLLKQIWRNKQLRALFINLLFVRAFAPIVKKTKKVKGKTKKKKGGKSKKKSGSKRPMTAKQKAGLIKAIGNNKKMKAESKRKALQTLRDKKTVG